MKKEIKDAIDAFLEEFKSLEVVKNYLALKKAMSENKEFLALKEKHKIAQKEFALSLGTSSYEEKKKAFQEIEEEYNHHPYILNMKEYEQEIHSLLEEIELYLK